MTITQTGFGGPGEARGTVYGNRAGIAAGRREWWIAAAILVAAAFLIRMWQFGNPLLHVDEDFYLLVGDRMLHGALPYVDIWDRKPIGLFLIYAAIRELGGAGFVQYQVVATLFAAATAIIIARIAAHMTTLPAAVVTGILYLLLIGLAGGMGGQAPVFYNPLVAAAALVALGTFLTEAPSRARIRRDGLITMVLVGLAMQIKYSAVFEGVFFGILYLVMAWRARIGIAALLVDGALWIAMALLPTALAFGYYALRGQADAFLYANFFSISARGGTSWKDLGSRLGDTFAVLALPLVGVLLSVVLESWRSFPQGVRAFCFVMMWLGAAFFGYFAFGTFFDHYALPLMAPIAAACGPLFFVRRGYIGRIAATVLLLAGAIAYFGFAQAVKKRRGTQASLDAMVAAIRPHLTNCLYVYDGETILYYVVPSCYPSRYAFAPHLNLTREAGAIGVDPLAEIRRIMRGRPSVVVDTRSEKEKYENPVANALMRGYLARNYHLVGQVPRRRTVTMIYAINKPAR
ncbi:hypothetical protein [Flavisphingomonas formosensis]|uniref:hypothetical protein n=1 Tax=Flavisphingomonas formosensis TaxID=861534 RepID=UPI0012FBB83E|nr:hypothetical protein [Sphingomonas formosensis]